MRSTPLHTHFQAAIAVIKIAPSTSSKGSAHYLNDTNRFDVSSKDPSSGISVTTCNSKHRICLYRLGSE